MKKIVTLSLFIFSLLLFGFNFSGSYNCETNKGRAKNLTCGSCHGGSINTDIIIVGGLEEDDNNMGDTYVNLDILIPDNSLVSALQANFNSNNVKDKFAFSENLEPLFSDKYGVQTSMMEFNNFKEAKKEGEPLRVKWYLSDDFNGQEKLIINGVFANLDGTPNGDLSFYKEIKLENEKLYENIPFKLYPTIVNDFINIEGIKKHELVEIIDFSGEILFSKKVTNQKLDLTQLKTGYYFLKAGGKVAKFLKK